MSSNQPSARAAEASARAERVAHLAAAQHALLCAISTLEEQPLECSDLHAEFIAGHLRGLLDDLDHALEAPAKRLAHEQAPEVVELRRYHELKAAA